MNTKNLKYAKAIISNYQLKAGEMPIHQTTRNIIRISSQDLDAARTSAKPVSASKFGLETICGASCAVGAM